MALSEFTYWSPTHGAEVTRLSKADDNGQEFYAFVPSVAGRAGRDRRERAADALSEAMDRGLEPGEIRWR